MKFSSILLLIITFCFFACNDNTADSSNNTAITTEENSNTANEPSSEDNEPIESNNTLENNQPIEATTENNDPILLEEATESTTSSQKETIKGSFRSLVGVMHKLSCYCHEGGLITVDDKQIKACFKNTTMPEKSCSTIEVEGVYETIEIAPESSSPCAGGKMKVFMVSSATCN